MSGSPLDPGDGRQTTGIPEKGATMPQSTHQHRTSDSMEPELTNKVIKPVSELLLITLQNLPHPFET